MRSVRVARVDAGALARRALACRGRAGEARWNTVGMGWDRIGRHGGACRCIVGLDRARQAWEGLVGRRSPWRA